MNLRETTGRRHWHVVIGRGPWGLGRFGWRAHVWPNVSGGRTFGWSQVNVYYTKDDPA